MFGKNVSTVVEAHIGDLDKSGNAYPLNFAKIDGRDDYAFIWGVDKPVDFFEGTVVAALVPKKQYENESAIWIVAKSGLRPINVDILKSIDMNDFEHYYLKCFYETSCGAVVYRYIDGQLKFLMIKNKRSKYWGWPKGHIEAGETRFDTAHREVLEETGLHINIHLGFEGKSHYYLGDSTDKIVYIFIATTNDTLPHIQESEIEDYVWVPYKTAMAMLKFKNDRRILERALSYLQRNRFIKAPRLPDKSYNPKRKNMKNKKRNAKKY